MKTCEAFAYFGDPEVVSRYNNLSAQDKKFFDSQFKNFIGDFLEEKEGGLLNRELPQDTAAIFGLLHGLVGASPILPLRSQTPGPPQRRHPTDSGVPVVLEKGLVPLT